MEENSDKKVGFASYVKEKMDEAQAKVMQFGEESQKIFKNLIERSKASQEEGRKRLEELVNFLSSNEFVDKLNQVEFRKQVGGFRQEVLDLFGLASSEDLTTVKEDLSSIKEGIDELKGKLDKLEKKLATPKKSTAKKTTKKTTTKKTTKAEKKAEAKKEVPASN